jgi:hypothetical protein
MNGEMGRWSVFMAGFIRLIKRAVAVTVAAGDSLPVAAVCGILSTAVAGVRESLLARWGLFKTKRLSRAYTFG